MDDLPIVQDAIRTFLQELNFRVISAVDGLDALGAFAKGRWEIPVVINDLQMPRMDGVELLRSLKRISPQLSVIIASDIPSEGQLTQLKELGVRSILLKPFTAREFVAAVRLMLQEAVGVKKRSRAPSAPQPRNR